MISPNIFPLVIPIHREAITIDLPESLRANADDRLPFASLGRVEGGDGIVKGHDGADVRLQSSVPHPLHNLTQLSAIGYDNEVDRQSVSRPRLGGPGDGHQ